MQQRWLVAGRAADRAKRSNFQTQITSKRRLWASDMSRFNSGRESFAPLMPLSTYSLAIVQPAAPWHLYSAPEEAEFGHSERARQEAKAGQAMTSTSDVQVLAALTLARSRDTAPAQALAEELEK